MKKMKQQNLDLTTIAMTNDEMHYISHMLQPTGTIPQAQRKAWLEHYLLSHYDAVVAYAAQQMKNGKVWHERIELLEIQSTVPELYTVLSSVSVRENTDELPYTWAEYHGDVKTTQAILAMTRPFLPGLYGVMMYTSDGWQIADGAVPRLGSDYPASFILDPSDYEFWDSLPGNTPVCANYQGTQWETKDDWFQRAAALAGDDQNHYNLEDLVLTFFDEWDVAHHMSLSTATKQAYASLVQEGIFSD